MPFTLTPAHQISYQMYAGPGADSMRAASQQLRELAFSADTTADSLNDTLFDLDDTWIGGSSAFMTDAALRYLKWLSKHSKRLWQTANTIHHLANTYEDIRQRVVPPAAIEDNREADRERHNRGKRSGNRRTRRTISVVRGHQCASNEPLCRARADSAIAAAPVAGAAADPPEG